MFEVDISAVQVARHGIWPVLQQAYVHMRPEIAHAGMKWQQVVKGSSAMCDCVLNMWRMQQDPTSRTKVKNQGEKQQRVLVYATAAAL
jgi:hypothetical protein